MEEISLENTLVIKDDKINQYTHLSYQNIDEIQAEHRLAYRLAIDSLKSGQCNEPYERLISDILELVNLDKKHGWDGFNNI